MSFCSSEKHGARVLELTCAIRTAPSEQHIEEGSLGNLIALQCGQILLFAENVDGLKPGGSFQFLTIFRVDARLAASRIRRPSAWAALRSSSVLYLRGRPFFCMAIFGV